MHWLSTVDLDKDVNLGLPEIDDRYHFWRVPILNKSTSERIGEVVIDAKSSLVMPKKTTKASILTARLRSNNNTKKKRKRSSREEYSISSLRNNSIFCNKSIIFFLFP